MKVFAVLYLLFTRVCIIYSIGIAGNVFIFIRSLG